MTDYFFTYLHTGLSAGVMILAILLVRPLLRKAPRNISCLLWLLVALRLLLPFQLESVLSLQPRQLAESLPITEVSELPPIPYEEPLTESAPDLIPTPERVVTQSPQVEPETVLTAVWVCGTLAVLLYAMVSYAVLQYRLRDAVKTADGAWESDRIGGAFLIGYIHPRICIPTGLSQRDRSFILAHEQAHKRRGDHWWKLLGMICLSIHWYNPLVWLSYALLCRDIETACDEAVIRCMELEERKSYSFALLNCGRRLSGFLTYPVAFGEISLKDRVKRVLSYRKPGLRITAVALVLSAVVAICFMTSPTSASPSLPEAPTPVQITEPATEEPTAPTTDITTAPTEPVTEPTTAPTEPVTEPTELVTQPTKPKPTQPEPTKPAPIPEQPTATQPTEPPVTEPTTQPEITLPPATEPTETPSPQPVVTVPDKPEPERKPDVYCGLNIIWQYDEGTRQLTLQGTGEMDLDGSVMPWDAYKSQILKVSISDGITSISPYAFRDCISLRSITVPGSVTAIGKQAFYGCTQLRSVYLSQGLQIIGAEAFEDTGITSIIIPKTVILIESGAFSRCNALTRITFTGAPPKMKVHTFLWTTATAYYPEDTGTWRSALQNYGGTITWELCCTNHSYINGICERCGSQKGVSP